MQLTRQQRGAMNSAAVARAYMHRTGLTYSGKRVWTEDELRRLRAVWPDQPAAERRLPGRSLKAIERKASKIGLTNYTDHRWTAPEAARFRRLWSVASKAEILDAFPWANWTLLHNYAQWQRANGYPNLYRPKARPKPTGDDVIDAIVDQAFRHNYSLLDLDCAAGTGRYFGAGQYRYRRNWKHLARAVSLFGGDLRVTFPTNDR